MLSLKERISLLEADLKASPMRISVYRDLPFAILRYEPDQEWQLRREVGVNHRPGVYQRSPAIGRQRSPAMGYQLRPSCVRIGDLEDIES